VRLLSVDRHEKLRREQGAAELGHLACDLDDLKRAAKINELFCIDGGFTNRKAYRTATEGLDIAVKAVAPIGQDLLDSVMAVANQVKEHRRINAMGQIQRANIHLERLRSPLWLGFGVKPANRLAGQGTFWLGLMREIYAANATRDDPIAAAIIEDMTGEIRRLPLVISNLGVYLELDKKEANASESQPTD
jgi:hypothetical protein